MLMDKGNDHKHWTRYEENDTETASSNRYCEKSCFKPITSITVKALHVSPSSFLLSLVYLSLVNHFNNSTKNVSRLVFFLVQQGLIMFHDADLCRISENLKELM